MEVIDKLASGKAAGKDGIPGEVIRSGKQCLLGPLHSLLLQCWEEGEISQVMRNAIIITLYKNKRDRTDCNNYRAISLLSVVGKLFAWTVLSRLQLLAERIYLESQHGYRSERSSVDMVFSLRLLRPFDLVSRDGLFKMLPLIGCPPKVLSIVKSFQNGMMSTVQSDGDISEEFGIKSGVEQGCVLAPTLFGIFFSLLLKHAFGSSNEIRSCVLRSSHNFF